ncbi:MAG: cytochrome c biogenesis heme-transporting ATPase CcmA [Burkholderiales bacterium]|nr:cytochrome c biogenesis heme-transporting ATPase CcmA [Burkholderiales bacterium]
MLEITDLACRRGERLLFRGLSFSVGAGELLWIEGRNGAGKTSLLRILCGLGVADAGEIRWRGRPVRRGDETFARERLFLGHANALKDDLTVAENLHFAARIAGSDGTLDAVDRVLEACGLAAVRGSPVRHLSQGQRRRAALGRLWLAQAQPLWILDEPFSALDTDSVDRLSALLGAHLERGGAAVLTTHQEVALPAGRTRRLRLDA